jgi:hypothetical protein
MPGILWSQTDVKPLSSKELRKQRPLYINMTTGIGISYYNDFATSALTYMGFPVYLSGSFLRSDNLKESELGFSLTEGSNCIALAGENVYNSSFENIELFYNQLYKINLLSSEIFNFKLGWKLHNALILRSNSSLMNNSFGAEVFPSLMGSFKVTADLSRKQIVEKKFLFIRYKLNPVKRNISFGMNIGILNGVYRNKFAYLGQSDLLNDFQIFDNYQFSLFSGFRASTSLDYTVFLNNKNALRCSYVWDVYKSGKQIETFQLANHSLRVSLLFNLNNR